MMEEWRAVVGFEDEYEVSSFGAIKSKARMAKRTSKLGRQADYRVPERILKPWAASNGYLEIYLCRSGKRSVKLVHRIVAEAFIGAIADGLEVCHWNGIRDDNRAVNLRIDTASANKLDMRRHKTDRRGSGHPLVKLTEDQVREIRKNDGRSLSQVGEIYGVSIATVSRIRNLVSWTNV